MKKLILLILTCTFYHLTQAQTAESLSYERLLQFYQAKQYTEALQYLKQINADSTDLKQLKQLAYANFMTGNYSEAEKEYLKLNTEHPKDPSILTKLAEINNKLHQKEKATQLYLEVIEADSINFNAYKQLATLDSNLQSPSRKNYLQIANSLNPTDAEVATQLAETYFKETQFNKAAATLEPALVGDSNNLNLLTAKIPVSMALKRYKEAIKMGKTILTNYQSPPELLFFQMAICHREIKDYKTAITYLEKAIAEGISPKIASYYGLMGESYESLKQNKEAIDIYKKGLLFENNGSLYYNIALIYEDKLADKKNAISYYTQYLNSIKDTQKRRRHIAFIKNKIEELKR